jgi:hypothetical protein
MNRGRSLRQKLLRVVMLVTLAALLVSVGTMIAYDLRAYHQSLIGDMSTQAELLGHMSSPALAFDDQRLAKENLSLLRLRPKVNAGAIYNARGQLFAAYVAPTHDVTVPRTPGEEGVAFSEGKLVMFRTIRDNGELLGTVYLRSDYEILGRFADYVLIAALAGLLAYS